MKKLEIYIHIPFCVKKCDYCDFLSMCRKEQVRENYVNALVNEIKRNKDFMKGYLVDTVFIGGGTPSILEGKQIETIMQTLKNCCDFTDHIEITIECNPGTLECYRRAGINRISMGLQSANDDELKLIGRIHSYQQFVQSYSMARKAGFQNINVDIMSALPLQTLESYSKTLQQVTALNPEHISAYSLIVEKNTPLYDRVELARKNHCEILPDEETEREMYWLTEKILLEKGYDRYEISNYSKKGLECRHNIGYWERTEYLGFGIGAASLYKNTRYNNIKDLISYMNQMTDDAADCGTVIEKESIEKLSLEAQMSEYMFLGLRMTRGVSVKKFEQEFDINYTDVYGAVTDDMIEKGLLLRDRDMIRLTNRGIDISNYVMAEFLLE